MILLSPDAADDVERLRTFLDRNNPGAAKRALAAIWNVLEQLQKFPALGAPTGDADIRQMKIKFGSYGYVARYRASPETGDILITRIWHGREARE